MNTSRPVRFSFTRCARRHFLESAAAALLALLSFGIAPAALADRDDDQGRAPQHWVASWATSPAAYFVYVAPVPQNQALAPSPTRFTTANIQPDLAFPFPNANTSGANDHTIRSIVKPDLWGNLWTSDRIVRLDPGTNTWAIFDLPVRGTEIRHIALSERGDKLSVVVPVYRTSQMGVLTVRSEAELAALKTKAR